MNNSNDKRAKRCANTLRYYNDEWDERANLIDFLSDARHWCDREHLSFADLDRIAYRHYIAESDSFDGQRPEQFEDYEIHGVIEVDRTCEQVDDEEAQFWSLYGRIPGLGLECIGDFRSRELAEEIYARITGRCYNLCKKGD
jgi:hypothetical protein